MPRFGGSKFKRGGEREKSEYDQKVLDIRRVARVVAGGRRFSFRATVVIGNRRGKVGVGVAKGVDVAQAVEKATHKARKYMVVVPLTKWGSIPHRVLAKFSSARVLLKPAPEGSGIIAGGSVRAVADLAGIRNLSSKILSRSPNKLNNARAALAALASLKARE
ncbi:MAG: 30S ribosomal protein S5 [bacterium]|nr:30S ribosomal protein S5 [bacterium]